MSHMIDWTTLPFTPEVVSITKENSNIGSEGYRWCIKHDKIVVYNLNFRLDTASSVNTLLYSGFPTPKLPDGTDTRAVFIMGNGSDNKAYRGFVNQSGELWSDGGVATGWYNAQIIYFTS